jgi:hypothetical protein
MIGSRGILCTPRSRLAEDGIDHPAAPNMLGARPTMGEDVGAVTARLFESVTQDRHAVEGSIFVDRLSEHDHPGPQPRRVEVRPAERVPDDVPQDDRLSRHFGLDPPPEQASIPFHRVWIVESTLPVVDRSSFQTGGTVGDGPGYIAA